MKLCSMCLLRGLFPSINPVFLADDVVCCKKKVVGPVWSLIFDTLHFWEGGRCYQCFALKCFALKISIKYVHYSSWCCYSILCQTSLYGDVSWVPLYFVLVLVHLTRQKSEVYAQLNALEKHFKICHNFGIRKSVFFFIFHFMIVLYFLT